MMMSVYNSIKFVVYSFHLRSQNSIYYLKYSRGEEKKYVYCIKERVKNVGLKLWVYWLYKKKEMKRRKCEKFEVFGYTIDFGMWRRVNIKWSKIKFACNLQIIHQLEVLGFTQNRNYTQWINDSFSLFYFSFFLIYSLRSDTSFNLFCFEFTLFSFFTFFILYWHWMCGIFRPLKGCLPFIYIRKSKNKRRKITTYLDLNMFHTPHTPLFSIFIYKVETFFISWEFTNDIICMWKRKRKWTVEEQQSVYLEASLRFFFALL